MIKSKIETLLWRLGILNDEYIFLRNINSMKELSENECSNIWNVKNVHGDMNIKAFNNYFSRINKDLNIVPKDVILSIGCGDGILDKIIVDNTAATIYGFDFNQTKIYIAQKK